MTIKRRDPRKTGLTDAELATQSDRLHGRLCLRQTGSARNPTIFLSGIPHIIHATATAQIHGHGML